MALPRWTGPPKIGSVAWNALIDFVNGHDTVLAGVEAATHAASTYATQALLSTTTSLAVDRKGRVLYLVGAGGSDTGDGLSEATGWATFGKALPLLQPGDTLLVKAGTYPEDLRSVTITPGTKQRPITVRTMPNATNSKATITGLLWLSSPSWWRLQNLAVAWRAGVGDASTHMVKMTDGVGWVVEDCEFSGAQSFAALLITSVSGALDGWALRRCYVHDTGINNSANQDHNLYISNGLANGTGVVERCLFVNAPNGENIKMAGPSTSGPAARNIIVRYNTLVAANDQNVLIGGTATGIKMYRNIIFGNNFRAVRGFQLDGVGNRIYKNIAFGGIQGGTLFAFSDAGYHGLDIGAANQYIDPILTDTTLGMDGYRATTSVGTSYGHHASVGLDDGETTIYTQVLAPATLPTGSGLQANLTGGVALLQDNPDVTPDVTWLTAVSSTTESRVTVSFPVPTPLVDGSALQRVRVRVRRTSGSVMPTIFLQLLEGGVFIRSLTSVSGSLSATPEQELVGNFSLSELTDQTGAGVQIRIIATPNASGGDCTGEVASIAWDAAVTLPTPSAGYLLARTNHTGVLPTSAVAGTPVSGSYWDGGANAWTALPSGGGSGALRYDQQPADHNLKGWTFPPRLATAAQLLVSGTMYLGRVQTPQNDTITNVIVNCSTAGAGLTLARIVLYDSSGNLLGQTADQSTDLATTGLKTYALGTPVTVTVGWVYVGVLCIGTTGPTLTRAASTPLAALSNVGISGPFVVSTKAGQSAVPSPLGTINASNVEVFVGFS